jgi:quercetin dioxygenase-like cupin family protein
MEIKRNPPTLTRPDGDRVHAAPFVFLDIPAFIRQVKKEKTWKESDRNGITIFKSDNITVVITILKAGAKISNNTIDDFLMVQILDGEAEISTTEGEFKAEKKNAVTFHAGIEHSITATKETILLLTTFNNEKKDL